MNRSDDHLVQLCFPIVVNNQESHAEDSNSNVYSAKLCSKQEAFIDLGKQRTMKQALVSISVSRKYFPF